MIKKRLLRPQRLRRLPAHWSWIDHRLVRDDYLVRCPAMAWQLYLFLLTVADAQGLSYYSDAAITRRLGWRVLELRLARQQLQKADLIAHESPLYQVLELSPVVELPESSRSNRCLSLGQLMRRAVEQGGGHD